MLTLQYPGAVGFWLTVALLEEGELEATYGGESVFVRIMHLGLRDPSNYAQFLLFKKS